MKRTVLCLMAICLLACAVTLTAPQAKAAAHTDHCVCGDSARQVADHSCQVQQWQPLSSVVTLSAVDFKNVPGGYYYLDGDVTVAAVTDGNAIGEISQNSDKSYSLVAARQVSLCLNGHTITTKHDRVFKGVYQDSVLNICDCSGKQVDGQWQWSGTVIGGNSGSGSITYTYANSRVNIYGGNFTAKEGHVAQTGGGLFAVAQDRSADAANGKTDPKYASTVSIYNGNLYGGSAAKGGNFVMYHRSILNIYGGSVSGGTATGNGGNISLGDGCTLNITGGTVTGGSAVTGGNLYIGKNCKVTLSGVTVSNGTASESHGNIYAAQGVDLTDAIVYGGYPEAVHVATVADGAEVLSQGYTLANALTHLKENSYLKLTRDLVEEAELSGSVYLDMNGHDLSGVTVTGTLYGFDSATDGYGGSNAGVLSCTVDGGQIVSEHKTPEGLLGGIMRYLTIPGEESTYSFHRVYIGMTAMTLRPDKAGFGYRATFAGDEAVKEYLSGSKAYGYELWIREDIKVTRGYGAEKFGGEQVLTLGLNNILSVSNDLQTNRKNAETDIHALAYIQLANGQRLESAQVSYDLKDVFCRADAAYDGYNASQQAALQSMSAKFSETFMTWDIANTHHASGGMWTKVNHAGFLSKLTANGSYWDVKPGSYVLTSNVNISSKTLRITSGSTVDICLNGFTITGTQRMMRVYGTLNLCDCHAHGEAEGGMTSSFTKDDGHGAVFYTYYGSTFNLYGGNLKATGTLATSGVGAVSHENQSTKPDEPPGVMNMYGGTLSGGMVTANGGLLSVFHDATFNMYGGELYGGHAQGHAGAISAGNGCSVNLYGGSIHDCSADTNGGGLYLSGTAQRYIGKDMTIRDNTALQNGGNIYLASASALSVDGAVISGGDVYVHGGQLTLSGAVEISDLNMHYTSSLDADAMTEDARVGYNADVYGFLTNNTALADCFMLANTAYEAKEVCGKLLAVPRGMEVKAQTSTFRVGHRSVCIDPAVTEGVPLGGFGNSAERRSTGVQESLYANVTAITDEEDTTLILITYDLQRPQEAITNVIRQQISLATDVPFENIILSASHTHSTPDLYQSEELINDYKLKLYRDITSAAIEAMANRVTSGAQIGGIEEVKTASGKYMNFTRHYYYYDDNGQKQYCGDNFGTAPADKSPDNLFHVAQGDHSLQLIRFDRGEEKDVVLCNWAAHPTMTGGTNQYVISADYVGPLRDKVQAEADCYFSFVQGAAGNMNTTSRIDNETPYSKTNYDKYGQELARIVLERLEELRDVDTGLIQTERYVYNATVFKHTDEELAKAKEFNALSLEERRAKYKEYGYTSIYHASAIISKANMAATQDLELNAFSIGDSMGFYSLPGELWAESALKVKAASEFACTFTVGYTNGDWKYFVDGSAADGTYESYEYFYCRFVLPETTEKMIEYWQEALSRLYRNA